MSYPKFKEWTKKDKDDLIINFKKLEKIFNDLGYDIILHGGTLLGAIRDKDLILEDNDIDFIILHKSNTQQKIKKEIIEIDDCFHHKKSLCGYYHFLGNNHYFIGNQHFDGWHGWIEDDKLYVFYHIYGELNTDDVFPLQEISLRGQSFKIPNCPHKLLDLLYTKNWRTPSSDKPHPPDKQVYKYFDGSRYSYPNKVIIQKDLLLDLKELLDAHRIPFWLMAGTLLGAVRENNFLEHDPKDIDIGLCIDDYWTVKELLDKSDFKYKFQWVKEIAIYKGNNVHPHIDLFFHTVDEKNYYCYSYKPNPITEKWNKEWRMFTPKDIIEPLKDIAFLGTNFCIPNNTEKYLEMLYGKSWRIPNPNWKYDSYNNIDIDFKPITAIVTTFKREESLIKLVDSFCKIYPDVPLIIGNQNKEIPIFGYSNVKIIQLPENCGLSYARNELVKNVDTEFVLLLEDDFMVTKQTNIYEMIEVFGYNKNIGIVGGRLLDKGEIKSYEKFLILVGNNLLAIDWNKLVSNNIVELHKINKIEFGFANIIYNFFVAKTEVLKKYPWDNNHKIHSEHMDFFLNLKLNSDIEVTFVPNITINHEHTTSPEYEIERQKMYYDLIYKKYGIEKGYTIGDNVIFNYKENRRESL
jgi:phosphorylcholine metabolism protein LicD/GT2 family glycosyltransferase